jgi:quinol monooxygenase YgiN
MVHTVLATFKFKTPEDKQSMKDLLVTPEGLTKTRTFDGCVSIECYEAEEDTMVIWQKWDSKEHHAAYLKMRTDEGLLGKLKESLREELQVTHLENVRA